MSDTLLTNNERLLQCTAITGITAAPGLVHRWYGKNDTGTGAHPNQIFARQQRCDTQTGGFVQPYDIITIGEHLIHRLRQIHLEQKGVTE